jgi:hypothetical protein
MRPAIKKPYRVTSWNERTFLKCSKDMKRMHSTNTTLNMNHSQGHNAIQITLCRASKELESHK